MNSVSSVNQGGAAAGVDPTKNNLARVIAHLKRNQEYAGNGYSIANKLLGTALFGKREEPQVEKSTRV